MKKTRGKKTRATVPLRTGKWLTGLQVYRQTIQVLKDSEGMIREFLHYFRRYPGCFFLYKGLFAVDFSIYIGTFRFDLCSIKLAELCMNITASLGIDPGYLSSFPVPK